MKKPTPASKISQLAQKTKQTLVVIAIIAIFPVLYVLAFQLSFKNDMKKIKKNRCRTHIAFIHKCQLRFAEGSDGQFADQLSYLYPYYVKKASYFMCPTLIKSGSIDTNRIDEESSYETALGLTINSPGEFILIYEKRPNHGNGRHVVQVDGTLRWVYETEFQEQWEAQVRQLNTGK